MPFLGQCRKTFGETVERPLREKIPMSGGHVRIIYQDRAHRRGPIRQFVLRRLLVLCPFTARRRWLWLFRGVAPRPTKAARASIWLRQTDQAERWHCREDGSISRPSQGAESRDSPKRSLKRIDLGPSAASSFGSSCGAAIIRGLGNLRAHGDQISLVLEAGAQFRQLTRASCA